MLTMLGALAFVVYGVFIIVRRRAFTEEALRFHSYVPGIERSRILFIWAAWLGGLDFIAFGLFQLSAAVTTFWGQ